MADLYGLDFRRRLRSADRLSEMAIAFGLFVKTRRSRVKASLSRVTRCDQRLRDLAADGFEPLTSATSGLPPFAPRGFRALFAEGRPHALGQMRDRPFLSGDTSGLLDVAAGRGALSFRCHQSLRSVGRGGIRGCRAGSTGAGSSGFGGSGISGVPGFFSGGCSIWPVLPRCLPDSVTLLLEVGQKLSRAFDMLGHHPDPGRTGDQVVTGPQTTDTKEVLDALTIGDVGNAFTIQRGLGQGKKREIARLKDRHQIAQKAGSQSPKRTRRVSCS